MEHLGDITKLKGNEIPKVDIITGGSPCQDLSVAGKREGLAGERSGLFMEQIRIIKEMREDDRANGRSAINIRPRFMVWENVPGAFSSNKGEDFRCVLEETAKIADSNATIPRLKEDRNGKQKWSKAGAILGDGWSIAWRVHDAQFWGVPQRRKRISLVADFAGGAATEILFEPKSLYGNTETSREEREGVTTDVTRAIGETSAIVFEPGAASRVGGHIYEDSTGSLRANAGDNQQAVVYGISSYDSNAMKSSNPHSGVYEAETTRTLDNNGGNPACNQGGMAVVQWFDGFNLKETDEVCPTLMCQRVDTKNIPSVTCYRKKGHPQNAEQGQGCEETETNDTLNIFDNSEGRTPTVVVDMGGGKSQCGVTEDVTPTLATTHGGEPAVLEKVNGFDNYNISLTGEKAKTLQSEGGGSGVNEGCVLIENHPNDSRVKIREDGTVQTLSSRMSTGGGNVPMVMESSDGDIEGTLDASYYKGCGERQGVERTIVAQETPMVWNGKQTMPTLSASNADGSQRMPDKDNFNAVIQQYVVRRLTPLECERLQGYPDGWTDIGEWYDSKGKKHKDADSPRYKALGNSIALPFWQWMAKRMVKHIDHEATMGSLFDGIGGFPLVYSRVGCQPIWASEIEEFPMAVTKIRFPDNEVTQ